MLKRYSFGNQAYGDGFLPLYISLLLYVGTAMYCYVLNVLLTGENGLSFKRKTFVASSLLYWQNLDFKNL